MTTEQKARAYDEAIERAREIQETCDNTAIVRLMEYIFPELKESKDERIRKAIRLILIATEDDQKDFYETHKLTRKELTDWLEKQGEQKPVTIDIDAMVSEYANNREKGNEEFGKPVNCMIRAYRKGIEDTLRIGLKLDKSVEWSEEDEVGWTNTMILIKEGASKHFTKSSVEHCIDWLNSLKKRLQL